MPTVRFWSNTPTNTKPHAGHHWTRVLQRLTPGDDGVWGDLSTVQPDEDADWTVVVNHTLGKPSLDCDRTKSLLIQLEPEVVRSGSWQEYRYPEDIGFAATWTIRRRHFPLDWYLSATYAELDAMQPSGRRAVSACQTWKTRYPGHRLRVTFVEKFLAEMPGFDLYGHDLPIPHHIHRGMRCKDKTIMPYQYHFCSENSKEQHYFTEKIGDAWLGWSLPLYWGCPDLESFFPAESFIRLPLEEPELALEIVEKAVKDNEWEKRLPAIAEARRLVLTKYQVWVVLATMLSEVAA